MYVSDKRLCLDADGKVVDCESTEARELLVGEGGELPEDRARELGLLSELKAQAPGANKARTIRSRVVKPEEQLEAADVEPSGEALSDDDREHISGSSELLAGEAENK